LWSRSCHSSRSSYYDLPGILRWFAANIGAHHVHHLRSSIPYYRLPQTLRDVPDLRSVSRITLFQSFRCVRLVLWDESGRRLISFRDVRTRGGISGPSPRATSELARM
jgi:omega-6 fatty acid desaturase (delta-12 desaturase)